MLKKSLIEIFERDLLLLKKEIESYPDENKIWIVKDGINNPAGNLCLHICGNLQYYIGAILGNTGYIRKRDEEFSLKNIQRNNLLAEIDKTISVVKTTLEKLNPDDFEKEFPIELLNRKWQTGHFLIHLMAHLNYHIGQINYHRRLLTS